jgi:hypothetical protein
MNNYQARQRNAVRWANAINKIIDAGGIVLDESNTPVKRFTVREDGDVIETHTSPGHVFSYSYFINNPGYDNGCHTKIADFDKKFEKWTFIQPKHVKKLRKCNA